MCSYKTTQFIAQIHHLIHYITLFITTPTTRLGNLIALPIGMALHLGNQLRLPDQTTLECPHFPMHHRASVFQAYPSWGEQPDHRLDAIQHPAMHAFHNPPC